jgi:hypothetical protein
MHLTLPCDVGMKRIYTGQGVCPELPTQSIWRARPHRPKISWKGHIQPPPV